MPPTSSSLTDSRKRLDQISCPATRTRPKTRAIGAPSLDPITRNRSTRPVSTGSEPVPSSRWSIAAPSVAPIALPSTADAEPGDAAAERAAERRAGGGQQQRGHQRLLSGKRKTPAIRRDQAGVSGDSTTPWPE